MPFSNLLNTVLHFGFTMWQKTKDGQKTMGKKQKMITFLQKKQKKNKTVLP